VLSVDDGELDQWIARLRKQLSDIDPDTAGQILDRVLTGIKLNGVPYTVTVQARSALRFDVALSQQSRLPGTTGRLRATLTDSGVPLHASAAVRATVSAPDGTTAVLALAGVEPGMYETDVPTTVPGVYRILVTARGVDLRGAPFTREELRTLAVWARGDDPPPLNIDPTSGRDTIDVCGLLTCLLGDDAIRRVIAKHELDPDRITECVRAACG
jgi:hypothetical protein